MSDYNEEIVRRFYEQQGYLVRSNTPYRVAVGGGAGWSDIDLIIWHPKTDHAAAVEVKGWHTDAVTPGQLNAFPGFFHFTRPEATAAVHDVIGQRPFHRVLVVGRIAHATHAEVLARAADEGVGQLLEFAEVLAGLIAGTDANRSADSAPEHMIRVLRAYGFLTSPNAMVQAGPAKG